MSTDTVSKQKRSRIMSCVKSSETKLEIDFRKRLWEQGVRYRKNSRRHYGNPDIVLSSKKVAIFLDSCFWHGCKQDCRIPQQNKNYWVAKIERNRKRDNAVSRHYRKAGWRVFRIWEHSLDNESSKKRIIHKVLRAI